MKILEQHYALRDGGLRAASSAYFKHAIIIILQKLGQRVGARLLSEWAPTDDGEVILDLEPIVYVIK